MSAQMIVSRNASIGGVSLQESRTLSADAMIVEEVAVPAAQEGTLTTRTDDNTGTVTMDSSAHTVAENDIVDIYWAAGMRRGMVAGAPVGAEVPIDGGTGDVLPAQSTEVLVAVTTEMDVKVLGTNVVAIALASQGRGCFSFQDSGGEEWAVELAAAETKIWHNQSEAEANPITGDEITKVLVSHSSTTAKTMKVGILYDND